jgi:ADP-ribosyl-[dinitrogen reductase] hydrolase
MVSDDTEHTCFVAASYLAAGDDLDRFERELARRLRWWLLCVPAGVGLATLRATLKLWLGVPPSRSGVRSAGNGPAMRSAILGAMCDDRERLRASVHRTSRLTHTDPRAEHGALAVALAAHLAARTDDITPNEYVRQFAELAGPTASEMTQLLEQVAVSVAEGRTTREHADAMGLSRGVTGFVCHTVPICIHAWLSHPRDYRAAVESVIRCGGDTDTTAAITGGIVGAAVGRAGIPDEWIAGIWEWPRTVAWMEELAVVVAVGSRSEPAPTVPSLPVWGLMGRNGLFAAIVLTHGFRRLLPPY